ncbi:hypothetical protein ACH3XW_34315 [Acanthocheilonema viteae]
MFPSLTSANERFHNYHRMEKNCSKEEMRKLNDLIKDAHFQMNQMSWEKKVKDLTDIAYKCLHDDVADIINAQDRCINVRERLMKIFEYVKYDIQSRLSILQNMHMSMKSDSDITHISSIHCHQFHNEVNSLAEKPSVNDILSSVYAMESDLLKIDAFQKRGMDLDGYCLAIRSIIYNRVKVKKQLSSVKYARRRLTNIKQQLQNSKLLYPLAKQQLLNKNVAMLDNILAAMQHIITEIDKQFDLTYSLNRYIALFNELSQQFHRTHQKYFLQERWISSGRK